MKSAILLHLFILFFFFSNQAQEGPSEWKYLGPKEMKEQVKGLIKSVWVDPANSSFILAGSCSGGLFKTENGNDPLPSWKNISDSYNGMCFGVSGIVVMPETNNKTIFVATGHNSGLARGYGAGILKTENGGTSWYEIGPKAKTKNMFMLEGLECNPQRTSEMLAYSTNELFFTTDEWKTFQKIILPFDTNNAAFSICDVNFAPYEPGKFYVCTRSYNLTEAKLFECSDFGKKVSDITPKGTPAERIEVTTLDEVKYKGKFYLALGTTNVYVNYYNGKNYVPLNSIPISHMAASAFWNLELQVSSGDTTTLYVALTEVSRSINGGKTFDKIYYYNGENTHGDVRALCLTRGKESKRGTLYVANDGGISMLDTLATVKWKSLNGRGLDANQFWGIDVAQDDSLFLAGGAQDNGGFLLSGNIQKNTMLACGDGYSGLIIDRNVAVIECNPPSVMYYNIKTGQDLYFGINESRADTKRPLMQRDSFVYLGFHDVWRANKFRLQNGEAVFSKLTQIPDLKNTEGSVRNIFIKSMSIGKNNAAVICYANPYWKENEKSGKVFFARSINDPFSDWMDITALLNYNTLEICRWFEINAVELDLADPFTFVLSAKNPFDQSATLLFQVKYLPDSNRCVIKKINSNLPSLGINKIITDKFSGLTYVGCDDGVYYSNLLADSITWTKLNSGDFKLPSVMVNDIAFNYVNNTLVAATYGRGLWQTQLLKGPGRVIEVENSSNFNQAVKVDGKLVVGRKKTLTINSKLIITKGSSVELKKGGVLIVNNKKLIRDESNKLIDLDSFIHKGRGVKVIYR